MYYSTFSNAFFMAGLSLGWEGAAKQHKQFCDYYGVYFHGQCF